MFLERNFTVMPLSPQEYRRVPMRDIREAPNIRGGGEGGGRGMETATGWHCSQGM